MNKRKPIPVNPHPTSDDLSFKGCCTSLFRVIRSGVTAIEEIPDSIRSVADDISAAWEESAKPTQPKPGPTQH